MTATNNDDYVLPMSRRSWCHARGRNSAIVASLQPDQDCGTVDTRNLHETSKVIFVFRLGCGT